MKQFLVKFLLKRPRLFRVAVMLFSRTIRGNPQRLSMVRRFCLGRRARECLDHYLAGTGTPLAIETSNVFDEDAGVRHTLGRCIAAQQASGLSKGDAPVPQYAFSALDWRCALGSVNFKWKQEGAKLVIWFEEVYRWAPGDSRITGVFHRAAEQMKRDGAREFQLLGTPACTSLKELCGADRSIHVPIDRLYM